MRGEVFMVGGKYGERDRKRRGGWRCIGSGKRVEAFLLVPTVSDKDMYAVRV